ncbi:MAG: phosphate/phosphite/phosphonate ABC transporter substrate-binding protein [Yaniella sp.]|uniref:phosphate/phosphite/phosphonate ABC transporter substrate-binding protein n=1 Tax=Yaniella sp. TaxID=2773929 RepID=UPI002647B643|nr:phosphate/phosphite/phosphonate ABC transporter substrate-binding protein [Yaniella sp.]MDN5816025.1 phosphate/phosphite/phosphonate ABC transporter substrate-binding protein [Yaniella sp.]MDN5889727.1 phosphate/phosphite/phosphonate ABC transporter substrate-binding protein [Yaniella sp.]MDN6758865.1 phosphate/phosphite/phosphonate ABC transporter substrate-binding protein [Yaniella sp.]
MRKTPLATISMLAVSVLLLSGCSGDSSAEADAADGDWPEAITLSLVPSTEGEDLAEALDPLTSYLSDNLGIDVEGVVANDYAATVEALGADQADVVITDAGSLYNAVEQHDAELILRDVRFGATSYAAVGYTNNPDTYCDDEPVMATYDAAGTEMAYCNGLETAGDVATGDGPVGTEALENIDAGTEIALQAATSPAGYQYPVVAMQDAGIDVDNDITQVPVEGNNNAVLAVHNDDAEISFGYWDARDSIVEEAPDAAENVVAFTYTEMIPNGGVAAANTLPDDLVAELTTLMDDYAGSSDEAADVMYDLVGLSDWTAETGEEEIARYGEILEMFAN